MKKTIIQIMILAASVVFFVYMVTTLDQINEDDKEVQKEVQEEIQEEVVQEEPTIEYIEALDPLQTEKLAEVEKDRAAEQLKQAEEALAKQAELQSLRQVEMTYYLATGNPCANGEYPQEGMVAYSSQYIGYSVEIYTLNDELIGTYRITDTGYGRTEANGKGTIQNGNCIDIFMDSHEHGREFVRKYGTQVKIKTIEGE